MKNKWYYFDHQSLTHRVVDKKKLVGIFSLIAISLAAFSFVSARYITINDPSVYVQLEKRIFLDNGGRDPFAEEKFVLMLKDLNVKFPHIVYAQAYLETGGFKSEIFLENHNLFGMREARLRPTTAKGTNLKHAYYNNWRESVYDYVFYQCRYLSSLKTENEYFSYLNANYAEATDYPEALQRIIRNHNLKEKFDQ